jgi:hypothetical protein
MEQEFHECKGKVIFFYDFIVHGKDQQEHDLRLRAVMQKIKEKGLTLNNSKCVFAAKEIEFVGYHISATGIKPSEDNKQAILKFRDPINMEEVRSFLGLCNFSSRFIANYSNLTEPLRRLTKKSVPFEWGLQQIDAFKSLKEAITSAPALGFYDKEAQVITDASPYGLGAVLIQIHKDGPTVIQHAAKTSTDVESRYSQTEKEALALVWGCKRFAFFLRGKQFDLITDHQTLEVIFGLRSKPSACLERWVLRLQSFAYTVRYKPGKSNLADSLSRLLDPNLTPQNFSCDEWTVRRLVSEDIPVALSLSEVRAATLLDPELQALQNSIQTNEWSKEQRLYQLIYPELCAVDDLILRGSHIILPKSLHQRALQWLMKAILVSRNEVTPTN